jgi:hypothetical protein
MADKPRKRPPSYEERVESLERFRYFALGMFNAQSTMIVDLWCNWLELREPYPLEALDRIRKKWLANAEQLDESFKDVGVDPAHLQLVAQEYQEKLILLTNEMIRKLRLAQGNDPDKS